MLPHTLPMQLVTESDYLKYLENLAYLNFDISHSDEKRMFYSRFNDITGTNLNYPLMLVIRDGIRYPGTRDAMFEAFAFEIWILKALGTGNPATMDLLVNECKIILDDVISKIDEDSKPKTMGWWPIKFFKINEHSQQPIDDPLYGDKLVGYSAQVVIGNQKRFQFNTDKWRVA